MTPFPTEEEAQLDKTAPQWNPWEGPSNPHWYSGLLLDQTPTNTLPERLAGGISYRVVEGLGAGAASIKQALSRAMVGDAQPGDRQFSTSRLYPNAPQEVTSHSPADDLVQARETVQQLTPDAATTGTAVQVLHGLTKGLYEITVGSTIGGPLAGAGVVGTTEGVNRYDQLTQEGVSRGTAGAMAGITGITSAVGALVPFGWGGNLLTRVGTGALGNAVFGAATR